MANYNEMELEKLDYQKILRLIKKYLNETPMNSEKFRDIYDLHFKVECNVKKFDLHNVMPRWYVAISYYKDFGGNNIGQITRVSTMKSRDAKTAENNAIKLFDSELEGWTRSHTPILLQINEV